MKVIVRFIKNGTLATQPVTIQFLEEEMDAIEYKNQNINDFKWIPHREQQERVIRESIQSMHIDPMNFSWDYKQELMKQMEVRSHKS